MPGPSAPLPLPSNGLQSPHDATDRQIATSVRPDKEAAAAAGHQTVAAVELASDPRKVHLGAYGWGPVEPFSGRTERYSSEGVTVERCIETGVTRPVP